MKMGITTPAEFTIQLLKGESQLTSVCVTFEGPPEANGGYKVELTDPVTGYAADPDYKKNLTLWFPPGNRETFQAWIQIGTERMPVYPTRGMREMRYRARMGLCHGPLSREPYKGDLLHYGGGKSGTDEVPGKGFFALTDVEKIWARTPVTVRAMSRRI